MRITQNMLSMTNLNDIFATYTRLGKSQRQLSSGKLYSQPSDNPIAVRQSLDMRSTIQSLDQYMSNVDSALSLYETADVSLRNTTDLLQRAKELAVQGGDGVNTPEDLKTIAKEIDQILDEVLSISNTAFDGRYIFAGTKTATKPFTYNPAIVGPPAVQASVTYSGDGNAVNYEIEKGVNMQVNIPGTVVFKDSTLDPTSVFKILIDLRDNLNTANATGISTSVGQIDVAMSNITDALTTVGGSIRRLESVKDKQDQEKLNITKLLSDLEDADLAEVVMTLKMNENTYQAALMAGGSVIQKSLLDFLK